MSAATIMGRAMLAVLGLGALPLAAAAQGTPPALAADRLPAPQQVQAAMERVAIAQIDELERKPFRVVGNSIEQITANWVSATFYTGLTRLARVSPRPEPMRFLTAIGDHFNFAMRGTRSPKGLLNADDQAIGDLYQELYGLRREHGYILPTQQRLDYSLPHLTADPVPDRLVWWWCDALFMAPPVYARMSAITGDRRYLDAMDIQWWRTTASLFDPAEGLFFRDPRFVTRRADDGRKIFWARGNGWVLAGLARVLDHMPADYPARPRYLALFRQMAARVAALQAPDGLWRASLLAPDAFPEAETSGTALFTYALAWGINHGVLPRRDYLPRVVRGWSGLNRNVLPGGLLGAVQRTGDQPTPTRADDVGMYGTGAFLLAGAEVMRLGAPVQPLPVPLASPIAGATRRDAPARPVAAPAATGNPEARRRAEEMAATRALAYDPRSDAPGIAGWTAGPQPHLWPVPPAPR